jgi:hypothetical protein
MIMAVFNHGKGRLILASAVALAALAASSSSSSSGVAVLVSAFVPSSSGGRYFAESRVLGKRLMSASAGVPSASTGEKVDVDTVEPVKKKSPKVKEELGVIESAMRSAAMKLHTRAQSPKEGQVEVKSPPPEPFVPTIQNYIQFLVDSQHVYQALEDVVHNIDCDNGNVLSSLRQTGLERVVRLESDIQFMSETYGVDRPPVGQKGSSYATKIRHEGSENLPRFICHFYNYYFAHTAGGRMIGKKMASLLLEGKTLEFYKVSCVMTQTKNNSTD